ncbi:hypothetical protein K435DRAFT_854167 [Dendrothele bispora CBS 962.96]|uniref:Uncharacterized protein n=1 Tax=Dendrothele bispora (strain CBS 962.96) TaxID=1314807 RepID=A0A4S8MEQ6_DENBC|nr:hypothetical protein K435DRAFT_854167 [Dendrothele bispora CBS 962.96]
MIRTRSNFGSPHIQPSDHQIRINKGAGYPGTVTKQETKKLFRLNPTSLTPESTPVALRHLTPDSPCTRTRANPDSQRIGKCSQEIPRTFSRIAKPKVARTIAKLNIRPSKGSYDTSEGTSSFPPQTQHPPTQTDQFQLFTSLRHVPRLFQILTSLLLFSRRNQRPLQFFPSPQYGSTPLRATSDYSKMTNSSPDMGRHEQALVHMAPSLQGHSPS